MNTMNSVFCITALLLIFLSNQSAYAATVPGCYTHARSLGLTFSSNYELIVLNGTLLKPGEDYLYHNGKIYDLRYQFRPASLHSPSELIKRDAAIYSLIAFTFNGVGIPSFSIFVDSVMKVQTNHQSWVHGETSDRFFYLGCNHIGTYTGADPHEKYCGLCHQYYNEHLYSQKYDPLTHWQECTICKFVSGKNPHAFYFDSGRYWCRNCPYNAKNVIVGPQLVMQNMLQQINPLPSITDKFIE